MMTLRQENDVSINAVQDGANKFAAFQTLTAHVKGTSKASASNSCTSAPSWTSTKTSGAVDIQSIPLSRSWHDCSIHCFEQREEDAWTANTHDGHALSHPSVHAHLGFPSSITDICSGAAIY
ncbi:hypothetical protein OE88DRAFT_1001630 [Heliocybe sulcata]|uniref:Uncharacterized protein n=1 Tax=Heliocybe sulcata TaxID=5364 RepID=A0A5C3NGF2_9AGAM|nr:hypothetical protein OE88DRAFT_1001630 [Heliocybe sulcata]